MNVIDRAIKANFAGNELIPWQIEMKKVLWVHAGMKVENFEYGMRKHNLNLANHDRYRVKFGLLQNYIKFYG